MRRGSRHHRSALLIVLPGALLLASCATTQPQTKAQQGGLTGAAIGAIAGSIIGYQGDHSGGALRGALAGAAIGGALGAGVGAYMDKQQAEFERRLAEERRAHRIEVERLRNENLKITMNSEVSFDFDSAELKPAFRATLDKVADILARYPRTTIRITGHTDNIGSAAYNLELSRRRAESVAWYLEDHGVDRRRIHTEGRGESQPRADNRTEAGRQLNRRVEILIAPDDSFRKG
ncbi:MAG: OmpA family protein [Zetaproteobacteria bacterium]|nr:MAG: OmpA family protein [Zetaproteobacteria bacterium]